MPPTFPEETPANRDFVCMVINKLNSYCSGKIASVQDPVIPMLYYVHDPMCSWCWGFESTRLQLFDRLPQNLHIRRLLGGLAEDTQQPMADEMRAYIQRAWHEIEQKVAGKHFNFDFWSVCQPRRATWPACRAVIAARRQGQEYDEKMTTAIQTAYYTQARNPSDDATLIELADEIGLSHTDFTAARNSDETQRELLSEMELTTELAARSFPSLLLKMEDSVRTIPINYTQSDKMHQLISRILDE